LDYHSTPSFLHTRRLVSYKGSVRQGIQEIKII
jgi:hypothetical protein